MAGSSWISSRDVGRGIVDCLTCGAGGAFNLAGGFTTWQNLLNLIGREIGISPRIVIKQNAGQIAGEIRLAQSRSVLDIQKITVAVGFEPFEKLNDVIGEVVALLKR